MLARAQPASGAGPSTPQQPAPTPLCVPNLTCTPQPSPSPSPPPRPKPSPSQSHQPPPPSNPPGHNPPGPGPQVVNPAPQLSPTPFGPPGPPAVAPSSLDISSDPAAPRPGQSATITVAVSGTQNGDRYGVAGVAVSLAFTQSPGPDANISPASITSDDSGTATASARMSRHPGRHVLTATVAGLPPRSLTLDTLAPAGQTPTRARHVGLFDPGPIPGHNPTPLLLAAVAIFMLGWFLRYAGPGLRWLREPGPAAVPATLPITVPSGPDLAIRAVVGPTGRFSPTESLVDPAVLAVVGGGPATARVRSRARKPQRRAPAAVAPPAVPKPAAPHTPQPTDIAATWLATAQAAGPDTKPRRRQKTSRAATKAAPPAKMPKRAGPEGKAQAAQAARKGGASRPSRVRSSSGKSNRRKLP